MEDTHSFIHSIRSGTRLRWFAGHKDLAWLLAFALAGMLLVLVNTRLGAYLSDDSYYYIYPARDFAAGKGFSPSYIFAPLLPAILALISLTGIDALVIVRWLNAALFGVNLCLVYLIVQRLTNAPGFPILASALVLLADVVVEAHGWAMSEAVAFTFMLLSIYSTLLFLQSQRYRYALIMMLASALTLLSRYASLPLIAAIALTLLVFSPQKRLLYRLRDAAIYGVASLLPIAAYWLRNQLSAGHAVRYQQFLNVPFDRGQLVWFLYNWFSLFIPGRFLKGREVLAGAVITALVLIGVAAIVWWYRKSWAEISERVSNAGLFLCFAILVLNVVMLYLARGLTELDVFNPRYLIPMLIVFLVLLVSAAGQLWLSAGRLVRLAILGFFAIFLVYYAVRTYEFSSQVTRLGLGYSNNGWHNSETISYLREHPEIINIVSTGEMGVYFWTGRLPISLVHLASPQKLQDYLCQKDGALFLMDQMPADIYGISHDDAAKGLKLAHRFNDSEMYVCPRSQ